MLIQLSVLDVIKLVLVLNFINILLKNYYVYLILTIFKTSKKNINEL